MNDATKFDLSEFLPYLLSQAADKQGRAFSPIYKDRYGMLRTEWRVLFHLGQYGDLTAKAICDMAQLHKTKTSRAVSALEAKRFVTRSEVATDRRHALLKLTPAGRSAYLDLSKAAAQFDQGLVEKLGSENAGILKDCLIKLSKTS
jgi:DNA-binding MarR family transcriptional regulator